jgi:hypothetical protein
VSWNSKNVWAFAGFTTFGLHGAAAIALDLAVVVSCEVGIFLMALTFYSERSGQDDRVHHVRKIGEPDHH